MEHFVYGLITFLIVYTIYFIVLVRKKDKVEKIYQSTEATILNKKFKVNIKKIGAKKLANIIGITNSLIIAITIEIIFITSKTLLIQLITGFIILIALIFILYPLLALFLRKKYE